MDASTRNDLAKALADGENWLMARILHYAIEHDYAQFTATLEESWRASIAGISNPLIAHLRQGGDVPPIECLEKLAEDPATTFGRAEARLHRLRGIPLDLFLGLYKYYRRAYFDYIDEITSTGHLALEKKQESKECIGWYFDRIEIAFCAEWSTLDADKMIQELQMANRKLAIEKGKFLQIYESLHLPVLYVQPNGVVSQANHAAITLFPELHSAHAYDAPADAKMPLPLLLKEYQEFVASGKLSFTLERKFEELPEAPYLRIYFHRLLDISEKFTGTTIIFSNISDLHGALKETKAASLKAAEARMASEKTMRFLQKLIDALPVPIFYIDETNRYQLCNQAFSAFCERDASELLGANLTEIFPLALAQGITPVASMTLQERGVLRHDAEVCFSDNSRKRYEIFRTHLENETEELDGIIGACFDITERSVAMESLKKRIDLDTSLSLLIHSLLRGMKEKSSFANAMEILGSGYQASRAGLFQFQEKRPNDPPIFLLNQWFAKDCPLMDMFISNSIFFPENLISFLPTLLSDTMVTGDSRMHSSNPSPTGSEQYSYLFAPIFTEQVNKRIFWGFLGLIQCHELRIWDDNEQTIAKSAADLLGAFLTRQEELQELHLLAAAVASAKEAIVITDADLTYPGPHILFANPAAEKNSGYTQEELLGQSPRIFQGPQTNREALKNLRVDLPAGRLFQAITTNYRKDGTPFMIDWNISPVKNSNGKISNYVSIQRDITQQYEMEQRLSQASKMESIGSLAAGIAHEINSPAQFIGDNIQYALETIQKMATVIQSSAVTLPSSVQANLFEEVPLALKDAVDGLERVRKIVNSMKEFSHPSEDFAPTDINRCIETSVTICRNEWKHLAEIDYDFQADMPPTYCVRSDISQVIVNLVINAAQAMGAEKQNDLGKITIRTRQEEEYTNIWIEDNGPGIPTELLKKIFDPFFTTKPVGKGTGQGLFLASQSIIGKHHGHITASNHPDGGAIFSIQLPQTSSAL